jgi:hypothetical protein
MDRARMRVGQRLTFFGGVLTSARAHNDRAILDLTEAIR